MDRKRGTGLPGFGNIRDMLMKIEAIGTDLEFRGSIASPTLLIGEMTVSGQ